jgi:hypothetical protein
MALPNKGEIIGQFLLKANNGTVTPDSKPEWAECETYLAMAVNYIQIGNYWLETKAEGEHVINPLMLTAFNNVPIVFDTDTQRSYSDLPSNVISISKGRALTITTMCGRVCFPLQQSDDALERFYGKHKKVISYQLEGQKRVWLYNLPKLITGLRPKYIVAVHDVDDTAEIILPSDGYVKVVDLMFSFFTGEIQVQPDYAQDGKTN